MRRLASAASAATLCVSACALSACATTINPNATTRPPGDSTTTTVFVASGSTSERLGQLVDEAVGLSEAIVENEGQLDIIARIDTLWAAARPGVERAVPDNVPDNVVEFDRAIELMRNGVDRRRPADADKALTNLRNLIASLPPADD